MTWGTILAVLSFVDMRFPDPFAWEYLLPQTLRRFNGALLRPQDEGKTCGRMCAPLVICPPRVLVMSPTLLLEDYQGLVQMIPANA
jgi:hypothetical protein